MAARTPSPPSLSPAGCAGAGVTPRGGFPFASPELTDAEFAALTGLIRDQFGVSLTEAKRSLLIGRLQQLLRRRGLTSFRDYYQHVLADRSGQALIELVNRITTNHTAFFREEEHFECLRQRVLPEVLARHRAQADRDLRIWCAGCATGEEAYSLLITLRECCGADYGQWAAGLLATDISAAALATAVAGTYPADRLETVPPALRQKYFRQEPGGTWAVSPALRQEITFRRFNLMNAHFPFRKPFDIIFCRNVMIYFEPATKAALVARFAGVTAPGGYLFVGHSESLDREQSPYRYVVPAVYRKEPDGA